MNGPTALVLVAPELVVLGVACAVLLAAAFGRERGPEPAYWLAQAGLLAALAANSVVALPGITVAFNGMFLRDPLAVALKGFIFAIALVNMIYSRDYLRQRGLLTGEYFALALFAVLGMQVLVSAGSLLTVYLGLELMSLALYSMVAMHRESAAAAEAAMKYFVLGALASGMLLYGMSILYGVTGTLELAGLARAASEVGADRPPLLFALVFVLAGVAFKFGAAPFHMWVPDVYHGAPTAVTVFIATAPKLSALAMAVRLLAGALPGLAADWQLMLEVLAVLSMAIGNIVAIAQSNLKRMLAYSTIAHMGFLLLGMLSATPAGYAAAMFYAIVYALMSLGAFGAIILLGRAGDEADRLADFKGLNARSPWFALMMLILMFSLAGVPPFAGFWAKWFVLKEVVAAGDVWLATLAVVFSIIGAYYYLRVVKLMYFDPAERTESLAGSADLRLALSANGLAVLFLGIAPGFLMALCLAALGGT